MNKFQLVRQLEINPIGLVSHYKHHTGLQWIHIAQDTKNNVFNLAFKTEYNSSAGISHILEHTTLCGSQLYPTRDPFFKMLNRSYSNFMNAMTGDDITMYPFSTTNEIDYHNLMDVYLDSCFKPLLTKLDFLQEGWRLENVNLSDPASELTFKGVVYNEMKGALADPGSLFHYANQKALFANSIYGYISGGDPAQITSLSHQELKDFHADRYHPSNGFVYTFGNFDLERQMDVVDAKLDGYMKLSSRTIDVIKSWATPQSILSKGPVDKNLDLNKQNRVSVSFLTNPSSNLIESYTMRILSDLLLDGAASPMYKALIESKLGSDYAPNTGYNPHSSTTSQSFGLQGVASDDIELVKDSIMNCLKKTAADGMDLSRIQSTFHQIELSLKHRTSRFGMNLGYNVLRSMVHSIDPFESINFKGNIERTRELVDRPGYLQSKIQEHFLDNRHRLDFVMEPCDSYSADLVKEEASRLAVAVAGADLALVYKEGIELKKMQDIKQDLSCLPCLPLSEVPKLSTFYPTTTESIHSEGKDLKIYWRKTVTNGVSYINLKFDITHLPESLIPLMPLFCSALTSLGTMTQTLAEFNEQIRQFGGISASCSTVTDPHDISKYKNLFSIHANGLDLNIESLYELILQLFDTNWMAKKELETCIQSESTDLSNSIVGSGHVYAMRSASSTLTPSARQNEQWSGLEQLKVLEKLDYENIGQILASISAKVLGGDVEALVISDRKSDDIHRSCLKSLLLKLHPVKQIESGPEFVESLKAKCFPLDVGINFVAKSYVGVPYSHPDSPALRVFDTNKLLSSLMTTHFLHRELREKGGAYGGGARYSPVEGLFHFMTYRDPIGYKRTLATFDASIEWSRTLDISTEELDQAKLDILKSIDGPINASQEGIGHFYSEISIDVINEQRKRLFEVTAEDVRRAAKALWARDGSFCVVGEKVAELA